MFAAEDLTSIPMTITMYAESLKSGVTPLLRKENTQ